MDASLDKMRIVLFVCVGNSARSQMAEAFFDSLAPKGWKAFSAGTRPADRISSKTIEIMREVGIYLDDKKPRLLTRDMVDGAEKIITMGCLDDASCPAFLVKDKSKIEDWKLRDPRGLSIEEYRVVRDEIKKRIQDLISKI